MSFSQGPPSASLRLPAPYLFVGPPSQAPTTPGLRDGSNTGRPSLERQRSNLEESSASPQYLDKDRFSNDSSNRNLKNDTSTEPTYLLQPEDDDTTEAIWLEMQQTLDEVTLTAANGLNNVFGSEHARALAELRAAQVRLAEAWGRSEIDDEITGEDATAPGVPPAADKEKTSSSPGILAKSHHDKMGLQPAASGGTHGKAEKTQLEEDTDADIVLARERRQANDRYFERVNKGVVDVVAKLDEVAARMKQVENESKEIWNERESWDGDST